MFEPDGIEPALIEARRMADEHKVPVIVEIVLERVTNIAMGSALDNMTEFEGVTSDTAEAPTTVVTRAL